MLQEARNKALGIGQGQELGILSIKVLQAEPGPCDYCFTIEGESELSRNRSIGIISIRIEPTTYHLTTT